MRGLVEFKSALVTANFTPAAVAAYLGHTPLAGYEPDRVESCGDHRCPPLTDPASAPPLAILVALFLRVNLEVYRDVGHNLDRPLVERVLGRAATAALLELGVLTQATHARPVVHSTVMLTPYDDGLAHIATDFYSISGPFWAERGVEPVMAIGLDSAGLVYGAPRDVLRPRLLDLCTGSGVQAIIAALHYAEDVTLVDLNARAVRFARFNLLLNGIGRERSRVYQGSLYEALPPGTPPFDAILAKSVSSTCRASPPFVTLRHPSQPCSARRMPHGTPVWVHELRAPVLRASMRPCRTRPLHTASWHAQIACPPPRASLRVRSPPYLAEPLYETPTATAATTRSAHGGDTADEDAQGRLALYGAGGQFGTKVTAEVVRGAARWLLRAEGGGPGSVVRITATVYNHARYEGWLREWWHAGTKGPAEVGRDYAEMGLYTGNVWTRAEMRQMRMQIDQMPAIVSGGNALIWMRMLPASDGGRRPPAQLGGSGDSFYSVKLHSYLWHVLNSETGLRPWVQYLLRLEPGALLADYAVHLDSEGRPQRHLSAAWRACTAQLALGHLSAITDVRSRALPVRLQDRLFGCVHARLVRLVHAAENEKKSAARDEL